MTCPLHFSFYDQKSSREGSFNPGGVSLGWCLEACQGCKVLIAREETNASEK